MRVLALLLVVGCGSVSVDDAGVDAGKGPPFLYWCRGYRSCPAADGGTDATMIDFTTCEDTEEAATAKHRAMNLPTCGLSGYCTTDAGACSK